MKIYIDSNILIKLELFKFSLISAISRLGDPVVTSHVAEEVRFWPPNSLKIFISEKHLIKFESINYHTKFDHFILSNEMNESYAVCTMDANLMRAAHSRGIKVLTISKNRRLIMYKIPNLSFDTMQLFFK